MQISKLVNNATVDVLLFICQHGSVRHREVSRIVKSRGTLSIALRALLEDGLISRHVDAETIPVKTYYTATEKGKRVAEKVMELKNILLS